MKKQFKDYREMSQYISSNVQSGVSVSDMMVIGEEVKKLKPGQVYLEIGVSEGASLATAYFSAQEGVYVIGIDIIDVVPVSGITVGRAKFMEQEMVGKDKKCFYIHGDADEFAAFWQMPIDVLFIDASHNYESVKNNTLKWEEKVKEDGVILFHDFDHADVKRWLEEKYGENKEILHDKIVRIRK